MSDFNLIPLLPEIFLAMSAMGLLIVGVVFGNENTRVIVWASVFASAIAFIMSLGLEDWHFTVVLNGMFTLDPFAGTMKLFILLGMMVCIALSERYLQREGICRFEYPVLILLAGVGMMLMVSAHNLLAVYMALELQSLSLYVLAAFHRNSVKSSEAGVKYFVLGAISSGLLLFGISLIYGFSGQLGFTEIAQVIAQYDVIPTGVTFGLVFILAGLAFKISAVPFHMWTPDVYQGAPTSVTTLFAIVPKIAAIALLVRLLFEPFIDLIDQWQQIIYFLSVASMVVGAFAALVQESIKRLIAYSSIGHIGYALIGLAAGTQEGVSAVVLYMLIYMVMSAGVFTIVLSMRRGEVACEKIDDLKGLSRSSPFLAYAMAAIMFSMAGIPPLAGFFGKFIIFNAAVAQGMYVLATIGVLSSVVAAYYYLRIIKLMFFDDGNDALNLSLPFVRKAILTIALIFIVGFAFKASVFIGIAQGTAASLFIG